jgi:hypothetical protein
MPPSKIVLQPYHGTLIDTISHWTVKSPLSHQMTSAEAPLSPLGT